MRTAKGTSMQDLELPKLSLNRSSINHPISSQNLQLQIEVQTPPSELIKSRRNRQFESIIKGAASMKATIETAISSPKIPYDSSSSLSNLDRYLHRDKIGLNVANQMKMINNQIDSKQRITRNKETSSQKSLHNNQQQPPILQYANLKPGETERNKYQKLKQQQQLFNLTQSQDDSQVQNLKRVLKICNTQELDKQSKIQREKQLLKSNQNLTKKPSKQSPNQLFRIHKQKQTEKDPYFDEKVYNLKELYRNFDDSYSELFGQADKVNRRVKTETTEGSNQSRMDLINGNNEIQIEQKRFQRINPIKEEFFFDLKKISRTKRLKEERLNFEQASQPENLEFLKKRNQISVILERTKKVNEVKELADRIEDEIKIQDHRIAGLLVNLGTRLELD